MEQLLKNYSLTDTILFIIILAAAIKGVIDFVEWSLQKNKQVYDKEVKKEKQESTINALVEKQKKTDDNIEKIVTAVNRLVESDKDDIRAWITEKHHYFCYEKKYIDDYSLDCLERRYSHYKAEGGNSYVSDLMEDLRHLPKVSGIEKEQD